MSTQRLFKSVLLGGVLILAAPAQAKHDADIYLAAGSVVENTELNKRDKAGATLTPEKQKETKKDINITAQIRKVLIKDKSLSVNGHNVKIITRDGVVTLRGPVENPAESMAIEKIAQQTRGAVRINNQLEVKGP